MAAGTYKRRRDHRLGMFMAVAVVIVLVAIVGVKSMELKARLNSQRLREADLEKRIEEQMQRSEEIAEFETYTKTRKYIEEVAKEKLGLIYEGEIIFRNARQ